jgi:GNAT superfamily N-acetyltransferase
MRIMQCMDYEVAVAKAWASDPSLIEKYHVRAGQGLEACVMDTLEALNKCQGLRFYDVYEHEDLAGFFATEYFRYGNFLTTFFLYPQFRSLKNKKDFISLILEFFGKERDLYTAVYSNNKRAVDFLEENGFYIIEIGIDKDKEFYIFKHE